MRLRKMKEYLHIQDKGPSLTLEGSFKKDPSSVVGERILLYKGRNILALQFSGGFRQEYEYPVKVKIKIENGKKSWDKQEYGEPELRTSEVKPYVIVPGYVLSTANDKEGKKISQIEPIKEDSVRKEISDLVKSTGMDGKIDFWGD